MVGIIFSTLIICRFRCTGKTRAPERYLVEKHADFMAWSPQRIVHYLTIIVAYAIYRNGIT
jgi:hypothetical protein